MKRFEEAFAAFESCIKLSKDTDSNPYQYQGKGQALLGLEQYEKALDAFDEAIHLSRNKPDPQFYHDKVVVYKRLSDQAYILEQQARVNWKSDKEIYTPLVMMTRPDEFTLLRTISDHTTGINNIDISSDGQFLASG